MRIALIIAVVGALAGCQSNGLAELDREVTTALRQNQLETLGAGIGHDPNVAPVMVTEARPGDAAYQRTPGSKYPAPGDLPARRTGVAPDAPADNQATEREGTPIKLNLEQAVAYAIANSREYRNRKDDLFLAAIDLLIEKHLWGPRFFNTLSATATGTPESGDHDQALTIINDLRVTKRLPYGGEVSVAAVVNFVQQLRTASTSSADDSQSADLVLQWTVPLMRGAGKVAQEDLIQAYRDLTYAARSFEQFRGDFLVALARDYFSLLLVQNRIQNLEGQVKNLEWLSKRIEALASAGREPFFEVQRSQQEVLFARNDLLREREAYEAAVDAFQVRLGMPTTQKLELVPAMIEVPLPAAGVTESVRTAWDFRLDLQTAHNQIDDARRKAEVARNQLLPDLDLTGNVRLSTDADKKRGGVDLDLGSSAYTAGVVYGAALDRKSEALQHRAALVALEQSERSYTLLRDQIANDVKASIREIELANFTLDLQTRNLELAQKRRDGVVLRLRTLGPRDFIEAEDDLRQALDRRDAAVRDLRVSVLQYLLRTGQMRVSTEGKWQPPGKLMDTQPPQQPPAADHVMGKRDSAP